MSSAIAANPYRLLNLTKQTLHTADASGYQPKPGITVSPDLAGDHLMVEIFDNQHDSHVSIDGEPVFDIAVLPAQSRLKIYDTEYVAMAPLSAFVKDRPMEDLPALETLKLPKKEGKSDRRMMYVFAITTAIMGAILGFTLLTPTPQQTLPTMAMNTPAPDAQTVAPSAKQTEPNSPNIAGGHSPESQNDTTKVTTGAEVTSAVNAPNQDNITNTKEIRGEASSSEKGTSTKEDVAKPATKPTVTPKPIAKQKPVTRRVTRKAPKLAPQVESRARDRLESYRLEAGFDPEGAMKKMQALSAEIPHGTTLRSEIDKAIRNLRKKL